MRLWAGIDPGLEGCVAVIDQTGFFVSLFDMPIRHEKRHKVVAVHLLAEYLEDYKGADVMVEIQNPRPQQGVRASFTTGLNYGRLTATLDMLGMRWDVVQPKNWKQWAGVTKDKETSLALAREKWPEAPLTRKKDHDRAEALLIAEYGRRHA